MRKPLNMELEIVGFFNSLQTSPMKHAMVTKGIRNKRLRLGIPDSR